MTTPGYRVRFAWGSRIADGEPSVWFDATPYVRRINTTFGRDQDLERVEAATAVIELDNADGRFTPGNTAGAYGNTVSLFAQVEVEWLADGSVDPFTLGTAALGGASATLPGTAPATSRMFRGLVERFTPEWTGSTFAVMTIEAVDYFRWLAARRVVGSYPAQKAGARIAAVLSDIGNPFGTAIDPDGVTLAADPDVDTNALDYLREMADWDGGLFFARGNTITFISRAALQASATYVTSQALIGDVTADHGGRELEISFDEQFIVNRVTGNTAFGVAITPQEDADSQDRYLLREKDFGDTPLVYDAELRQRAAYEIENYADPRWRISGLVFDLFDPDTDSETLINLGLMNKVTIQRTPNAGDVLAVKCLVQGFDHEITPDEWRMTIRVSSAPDGWVLGESTLGETTIL